MMIKYLDGEHSFLTVEYTRKVNTVSESYKLLGASAIINPTSQRIPDCSKHVRPGDRCNIVDGVAATVTVLILTLHETTRRTST